MYKLITIQDTVRVPPDRFNEPLDAVIADILRKSYGGITDKNTGVVLAVTEIKKTGVGRIMMGDGASYHEVVFDALAYKPEVNEVVLGEVVEVVDFGGFVRLGPMDGLAHVSQVMDDFVGYDKKKGVLYGEESKRMLKEGDKVRARVATVALKSGKGGKIGLTMRQPGLGKLEWIKESRKEAKA